jgi:DNA-directed RNA polymerase subunit F
MKRKELINLLNRAAAGLESGEELSPKEFNELIEDLVTTAKTLEEETQPILPLWETPDE